MKKLLKMSLIGFVVSLSLSTLSFAANTAPTAAAVTVPTSQQDIVAVAMSNKNLSTLVTAIKAAGLVDTLKGPGPFTVFAPTNAAFAKLPKGTLEKLLKNKAELTKILTYHVVSGKVMAADIVNGPVNTVEGQPIVLKKTAKGVDVNNAMVVKADIQASNGVIHVINTVLLPTDTK